MPKPELLETFPNPYPGRAYEIHMVCPEFTSLCPLGGVETDAAADDEQLSLLAKARAELGDDEGEDDDDRVGGH